VRERATRVLRGDALALSFSDAAAEVEARLAPFKEGDGFSLPRTLVVVTARR